MTYALFHLDGHPRLVLNYAGHLVQFGITLGGEHHLHRVYGDSVYLSAAASKEIERSRSDFYKYISQGLEYDFTIRKIRRIETAAYRKVSLCAPFCLSTHRCPLAEEYCTRL